MVPINLAESIAPVIDLALIDLATLNFGGGADYLALDYNEDYLIHAKD